MPNPLSKRLLRRPLGWFPRFMADEMDERLGLGFGVSSIGGKSKRSFDDWWITIPEEFKLISYNIGEVKKPSLIDVRRIISKLLEAAKDNLKPTEEEIQDWLNGGLIDR